MTPPLTTLQEDLGITFNNQVLLQQVFVHRSYLNENRSFGVDHNERLEFLGDAVLELVVTDFLYNNYPNPEGELTAWRSSLVRGEKLAEVARSLNFQDYLLLSFGEAKSGGRDKGYILANAFEAFIGALYLDQGYQACEKFIQENLHVHLEEILAKKLFIDPKSQLQEITQAKYNQTPNYLVIDEQGPDHAKNFIVAVMLGPKELARGEGSSKQAAQIAAAQAALLELKL